MDIVVSQAMEQKQILSLSAYQIQSLTVLSLGSAEVGNLLKREYMENPFLEQRDGFSQDETAWLRYYKKNTGKQERPFARAQTAEEPYKGEEAKSAGDYDWRQDVREQLYHKRSAKNHVKQMEKLIELLDDHGFLELEDPKLCRILGCSEKELLEDKKELADLEPFGLGCRTMGEFFLFQIQKKGVPVPGAFEELCRTCLGDITDKPFSQIAKKLGVSFQEVRRWVHLLGTLKPYPVDGEEEEPSDYIIPDLYIALSAGKWQVKVNDSYTRQYTVSDFYREIRKNADDPVMREYMDRKLLRAKAICEAVAKRQSTVKRMGEYLLKEQKDFFEGGLLKGMTYKACAKALEVHESTVCRLVMNKYAACPQGILPLSYFFSKGVKRFRKNGRKEECVGKSSVKELIADYIRKEDRQRPLSDHKLADMLKEEYGLQISKRTVTNYREELGIHSVYERKTDG